MPCNLLILFLVAGRQSDISLLLSRARTACPFAQPRLASRRFALMPILYWTMSSRIVDCALCILTHLYWSILNSNRKLFWPLILRVSFLCPIRELDKFILTILLIVALYDQFIRSLCLWYFFLLCSFWFECVSFFSFKYPSPAMNI